MKAIQIHLTFRRKNRKIERTLILPKRADFKLLHKAIGICFNLNGLEAYEFKGDFGWIAIRKEGSYQSSLKKLLCLKENEKFVYIYDALDQIKINCIVEKELDIKEWKISLIDSKGACFSDHYEHNLGKYYVEIDLDWIHSCLNMLSSINEEEYHDELETILKEICSIRFFQDHIHQQIFRIELPMNRFVYFGCDASSSVHFNYYASFDKLAEYMCHNPKGLPASVEKYHDCISTTIYKLKNNDDKYHYDYIMGNYGAFITCLSTSHDETIPSNQRYQYLVAMKQLLKCIQYTQSSQYKSELGKMVCIDLKDNISIHPFEISLRRFTVGTPEQLVECFKDVARTDTTLEIDILTVLDHPSDELFTPILAISTKDDTQEIVLQNTSFKTIFIQLKNALFDYWYKNGIPSFIRVRDENVENLLHEICKPFDIEIHINDRLAFIDQYFFDQYFSKHYEDETKQLNSIISEIISKLSGDEELQDLLTQLDSDSIQKGHDKIKELLTPSSIDYKKLN